MPVPPKEYIKVNHSDMFKLGESSRLYIYSFEKEEEEGDEQEELVKTELEQQKTRKDRMLKLYEEHKKQEENIKNSLMKGKGEFDESGNEGIKEGKQGNALSEEEINRYGLRFGQQINYSALREKKDLTDPQKAVIRKAEASVKRIEKLTRELEGIQAKQAKMLDLSDGQQQRYYKIEQELGELRETLDSQEENIRNMIGNNFNFTNFNIVNGDEEENFDEIKAERNFYKEWENQDYEDEFYDRSKKNKFNKNKNKKKITIQDIQEGDTYENVK